MPKYQGELDGLCGPYAIANAFEILGFSCYDKIFKISCEALAPRRWPSTIWEGTSLGDLQRMIKACREEIQDIKSIGIKYPFSRNTPRSNEEYWLMFDELFAEDEKIICAIIGTTRPRYHWIVASRDGGRIAFTDSTAGSPFVRKNRKSLFAGERHGNPKVWLIDRSELILFSAAN